MDSSVREIIELFRKMPFLEGAENNLYTGLHIVSQILLIVKEGRLAESGWGAKITMPDGSAAFTAEEGKQLEELVSKAEPILEEFCETRSRQRQSGGGADPQALADQIINLASHVVDPEKISIDNLYFSLTDYLDKLDDQNRSIARQIGPVAFTSELKVDPFIPNPLQAIGIPPPKFQIPARSILPITNAVLELLRLLVVISPIELPFMRNMLSISMAIFDVLRGEWKYGLFSLMGLLGNKPLVFGVVLKIIRDAWMLIEPNLADELRLNMYKASKSMFVGFWLWAFATFAPDFIRNPLEAGVGPFRQLVDQINDNVAGFQEQANVAAEPLGVKVTFPTVPTDIVPSFSDIQNLQTLVQQPEVYCSAPVKALLEPIKVIPPLRFVLEMLNIPLVPELQAEACAGIDPDNLTGELAKRLMPQVDIIPGGPAAQAIDAGQSVSSATMGIQGLLGQAGSLLQGKTKGLLGGLIGTATPNSQSGPETPAVEVKVETPAVEVKVETPAVETPVVETQAVETPAVETQAVETPSEAPSDAPAVETPAVETPAVETPAVEVKVETPSEALSEAPSVETPAVETPSVETQAVETPAVETPAVETQAVEAPPRAPSTLQEHAQGILGDAKGIAQGMSGFAKGQAQGMLGDAKGILGFAKGQAQGMLGDAKGIAQGMSGLFRGRQMASEQTAEETQVLSPQADSSRKLSFSAIKSGLAAARDSAITQKAVEYGRQAKDSKVGQAVIKYAPTAVQATTGIPVKNLMAFHKNLKEAQAQEQPNLPPVKRFSKEGLKRMATSPTSKVIVKHAPTLIQSTTGVPIKTAINVGKKAYGLVPQSAKDAAATKASSAYSSLKSRFTKKAGQAGGRRTRRRTTSSDHL